MSYITTNISSLGTERLKNLAENAFDLNDALRPALNGRVAKPSKRPAEFRLTGSPICGTCAEPDATLRCGACKDMHYCGKVCQTTDWPEHKHACKSYSGVKAQFRPGPNYCRVLVLDAAANKPRFEWLALHPTREAPLSQGLFRYGGETTLVVFNDRRLRHTVRFWKVQSSNPNATAEANKAIGRLLGAEVAEKYRGTFMVTVMNSIDEGKKQEMIDVGCDILRPVKEHLKLRATYKGPIFDAQPQKWYTQDEWEDFTRYLRTALPSGDVVKLVQENGYAEGMKPAVEALKACKELLKNDPEGVERMGKRALEVLLENEPAAVELLPERSQARHRELLALWKEIRDLVQVKIAMQGKQNGT